MKARTAHSELVLVRGGHASVLEFPDSILNKILPTYKVLLGKSPAPSPALEEKTS
jgi:hypothetical protein